MLIQYSNNQDTASHAIRITELVFLGLNIFCLGFTIMGISRVHLHFNLKMAILPVFIYIFFFHFGARLIILLHYLCRFPVPFRLEDSYLLVSASAISIFSLTYVILGMTAALVERTIATIYVTTYERNQRRYVGYMCLLAFPLASCITYPVFMEYCSWIYLAIVDVGCGVTTSIGFILLSWITKRNYRRLMASPVTHGYSLSQRWQMDENIKTINIVKTIVVMTGLFPPVNVVSFTLMQLFPSDAELYRSIFYCSIMIESLFMVTVGAFTRPVIRNAILSPITRSCGSNAASDISSESEKYFQHLQDQWATRTTTLIEKTNA